MKTLPYYFLGIAVLQGLVGMGLGVFMGISGDFTLARFFMHPSTFFWCPLKMFHCVGDVAFRPVNTGIGKSLIQQ